MEASREIQLSAGTIQYQDTGGDGPVIVFVHGLLATGALWSPILPALAGRTRCLVPELPLGAHRRPVNPDADLNFPGLTKLVLELLERLDLRDVTLVGSDFGLSQLVAAERPDRLARLVLCSCEAFDNCPPGLPGKNLMLMGRPPGGLWAMLQPLRVRALRRLPLAYGWMSKRLPHELSDEWLRPALTGRAIRRDFAKFIRTFDVSVYERVPERLRSFDRPALVVWASEDRVMPPEHGRRLADLLPQGRLVEIADSYTLIPVDQPAELARHIREFVREASRAPAPEAVR
jgi:pimeloyl-ACP methyl ester carboxylesterase